MSQITLKNEVRDRFTVVERRVYDDERLSMKSLGLYVYISSKPDGWVFYLGQLADRFNCGKDAIRAGLKELESVGLLERFKHRNDKGHFVYIYRIM